MVADKTDTSVIVPVPVFCSPSLWSSILSENPEHGRNQKLALTLITFPTPSNASISSLSFGLCSLIFPQEIYSNKQTMANIELVTLPDSMTLPIRNYDTSRRTEERRTCADRGKTNGRTNDSLHSLRLSQSDRDLIWKETCSFYFILFSFLFFLFCCFPNDPSALASGPINAGEGNQTLASLGKHTLPGGPSFLSFLASVIQLAPK